MPNMWEQSVCNVEYILNMSTALHLLFLSLSFLSVALRCHFFFTVFALCERRRAIERTRETRAMEICSKSDISIFPLLVVCLPNGTRRRGNIEIKSNMKRVSVHFMKYQRTKERKMAFEICSIRIVPHVKVYRTRCRCEVLPCCRWHNSHMCAEFVCIGFLV